MKCRWCDKSLPGDEIPACGSCLLRPLPQKTEVKKSESSEEVDEQRPSRKSGHSVNEVMKGLYDLRTKVPDKLQKDKPMKRLRIKSNSMRDRIYLIDSLVLHFDEFGIASFPQSGLAAVKNHMRLRPNRFHLLEDLDENPSLEEKLEEARAAVKHLQTDHVEEQHEEISEKPEEVTEEIPEEPEEVTEEMPKEEKKPVKAKRGRTKKKD